MGFMAVSVWRRVSWLVYRSTHRSHATRLVVDTRGYVPLCRRGLVCGAQHVLHIALFNCKMSTEDWAHYHMGESVERFYFKGFEGLGRLILTWLRQGAVAAEPPDLTHVCGRVSLQEAHQRRLLVALFVPLKGLFQIAIGGWGL